MRWETIEQILKVTTIAAQKSAQGYGIDQSYQKGVERVSQDYSVTYQTIGDACRRRLGLDNIGEFKIMLKAAIEGDESDLRGLLLRKTPKSYHERIEDFFSKLKNGRFTTEEKPPDTFVSYTIQLRKNDSDILSALSQLLGRKPEEILAEISIEAVKERMKKAVSKL